MKVVAGLRVGANKTNMRSEALTWALRDAGHSTDTIGRDTPLPPHTDLYVQSGFAPSVSLQSAIDQRVPYIIMEAPVFRSFDLEHYSSWGYNGLMGGAWRPTAPEAPRERPELQPMHEGPQLIIGQKPTDHSLRGHDHVDWILNKRVLLPEADFRPHPLMVLEGTLEPIEVVLQRYGEVYTYSSTVGVDAIIAGCKAYADSEHSLLQCYTGCRDTYTAQLSWFQAHHNKYNELTEYILSGYDEARARMQSGEYEEPRGKIDGRAIQERYHKQIVC